MTDFITAIINLLFANNGITLELGLIMLNGFLSILMGIQDYKIALISFFMGSGILLILFNFLHLDLTYVTACFLVSIVLMAFSIFFTRQGGQLIG